MCDVLGRSTLDLSVKRGEEDAVSSKMALKVSVILYTGAAQQAIRGLCCC